MAVSHQCHVLIGRQIGLAQLEHTVAAHGDVLRLLPRRGTGGDVRLPDHPIRILEVRTDLRCGSALEAAVVPLEQIVEVRLWRQAGQQRSVPRALQRAAGHPGELVTGQVGLEPGRRLPPGVGERDVRAPGVLAAAAPLGLAVAQHQDSRHGGTLPGKSRGMRNYRRLGGAVARLGRCG